MNELLPIKWYGGARRHARSHKPRRPRNHAADRDPARRPEQRRADGLAIEGVLTGCDPGQLDDVASTPTRSKMGARAARHRRSRASSFVRTKGEVLIGGGIVTQSTNPRSARAQIALLPVRCQKQHTTGPTDRIGVNTRPVRPDRPAFRSGTRFVGDRSEDPECAERGGGSPGNDPRRLCGPTVGCRARRSLRSPGPVASGRCR
jgi:hypothetical protein